MKHLQIIFCSFISQIWWQGHKILPANVVARVKNDWHSAYCNTINQTANYLLDFPVQWSFLGLWESKTVTYLQTLQPSVSRISSPAWWAWFSFVPKGSSFTLQTFSNICRWTETRRSLWTVPSRLTFISFLSFMPRNTRFSFTAESFLTFRSWIAWLTRYTILTWKSSLTLWNEDYVESHGHCERNMQINSG